MIYIEIIWYAAKLLIYIFLGLIYFIIAAIVRLFDLWRAIRIFQDYLHLYFKFFGLVIDFDFADEKTKSGGNTVFVLLNQTSFLDSLIAPLLPVPKTRGILNIEFALYPVIGWFLALANFVIVRQWSSQSLRTLNRTGNFLRSGGNIVISIEGRRSHNGKLSKYKKGPAVMAINNQSDIVPFIIKGTYESLPYRSIYTRPGQISVKLLPSISTAGLKYEDRNQIVDRLRKVAASHGLE